MAALEIPDEVVVLKARLNLEASRHMESIKIIEALMPENQRLVLLPGLPSVKKDVTKIIETIKEAREEMARREIQTAVRGEAKDNTQ